MKKEYIIPSLDIIDLQPEEQLSVCYKTNKETDSKWSKTVLGSACKYRQRSGEWRGRKG